MGLEGQYSRSGFAGMFDESKRYVGLRMQKGVPVVDADLNDFSDSLFTQLRRAIQTSIGDGAPAGGTDFQVAQAASPANNFKIKGGDGTDEGAAKIFLAGYAARLLADVDYISTSKVIAPRVSGVSALVLTDDAANYGVNELAGRTLTPDVDNPGTTFTIASNTATAITVTAGDLTIATAAFKSYRVELSTPGAPRTDNVYLDIFPDEAASDEDSGLLHALGGTTSVDVGSNGVNVNTFAGAGILHVISTASFATSGLLLVATGSGDQLVIYTGITGTTFTGCTSAGAGIMTTGGSVRIPPQSAAFRVVLRQCVKVAEGVAAPTGVYVDAVGRKHVYQTIAVLSRIANANVTTAEIADSRPALGGSSSIGLLATQGGIDGKATGDTTIFTPPLGKSALPFFLVLRVTAANTVTVPAFARVKLGSGEDVFPSQKLTGLTATGKAFAFVAMGLLPVAAAGDPIKVTIDTGATATTLTLEARLYGQVF